MTQPIARFPRHVHHGVGQRGVPDGDTVFQYQVGGGGATQIGGLSGSLFNSTVAASTLRSIVTATNQNLFADEYTRIVNRSITAQAVFQTAFTAATVTAPTNCVQPSTGNNQASTDLATISPTWATSRRPISAF